MVLLIFPTTLLPIELTAQKYLNCAILLSRIQLGFPIKLDINRLSITIHDSDNESSEFWNDVGIPNERIYKFGSEDNWWGPAGSEGPCGPCSELHYDMGPDFPACELDSCGPNCETVINENGDKCEKFVELWNLVFMQFYQDEEGNRKLLLSLIHI